jgi:hypothetical protein
MARATTTAKTPAKGRKVPVSAKKTPPKGKTSDRTSPGSDSYTPARFCELVGAGRHDVQKRLEAAEVKPVGSTSQGGRLYRLRDLVQALLGGDIEAEKLRKTKEEADKLELANARTRGELVEIAAVKRLGEKVTVAIRNRLLAMPLTDEEKDRCLAELLELAKLDWSRE